MSRHGTQDRKRRLEHRYVGQGASSSQDLLVLVARLFELSKRSAARADGNWSTFTYAGLPMLLAALQALVVEYEHLLNPGGPTVPADINRPEFVEQYRIPENLASDLDDLIELRNEIMHPAHVPTGTSDNWPEYLRRVKNLGLLNSTGTPNGDYDLLGQIASHRLFEWAIGVTRSLYEVVILSDSRRTPLFVEFLQTFDSVWFSNLPGGVLW